MTAHPETPNGDAVEMVRSEERVRASTTRVPVRRARLERFEVTEMQTITVPVVREDVRIVYEPVDPALEVTEQSAPLRRMVLTQERVVVTKERVPVELVGLVVETVTEQQEVTEEVRKEQITLASVPTPAAAPQTDARS
jgi:stress response protein YsnF